MCRTTQARFDEGLNVRLSSELRRRLDAAGKHERRRVTNLARIIWQDWLAEHASNPNGAR
jgi:hypothetical protein